MRNELIFDGALKQEFSDYLRLKPYTEETKRKVRYTLYTLDSYIKKSQYPTKNLTPDIIEGWLYSLPTEMSINTKAVYISYYRQFAEYLVSLGYTAFIPEQPISDKSYLPYIFSQNELSAIIKAADKTIITANAYGKHSAVCFAVIIRLLIGCGFRLNEVLSLKTSDVDLKTGIITVKNAKKDRDRLVPIHSSLLAVLKDFSSSGIPDDKGLFFPSKTGKKIQQAHAGYYFNKYLNMAGITKPKLKKYARNICIHCFRHTFAVNSFKQLDRAGKDLYDEIPILSVYMGHSEIYGTEKYLHLTAENSEDIREMMDNFNNKNTLFPEVYE